MRKLIRNKKLKKLMKTNHGSFCRFDTHRGCGCGWLHIHDENFLLHHIPKVLC